MKASGLGLFFLTLTASSVGSQVVMPTQETDDVVLIQRAGLRWIRGKADQHPSGDLKTVCLTFPEQGRWWGDPGEERTPDQVRLEDYVRDSMGLRVRPCEELEMTGEVLRGGLLSDAETGEPAAHLYISPPEILEPGKAEQYVGYHLGRLWGEGFICTVEKMTEWWWGVRGCRRIWES